MLSYNQINDIFQTQLGRNATQDEASKLSTASIASLGNLQNLGYTDNVTDYSNPSNLRYGSISQTNPDGTVNIPPYDPTNTSAYNPNGTPNIPPYNPGSAIQYNPNNPYNLNPDGTPMAGTGNYTGSSMPVSNPISSQQTYDPTNPYQDPAVIAAEKNVEGAGAGITAGNRLLSSIPQTVQGEATGPSGFVSASQLNAMTRQAEAPAIANLKTLGQQYNAAKSTYSATLSAAKQAISQAKQAAAADNSQVSREQSRALTQAGKIITLLQNGELDPTKVDLSQIESDAGLPTGFFNSITAKAPKTTTKDDIRSVQGGLYNVTTGKWIIPAKIPTKQTTTSNTTNKTAFEQYLYNQGLPLTLATNNGTLSSSMLNKIVSAGVPLATANGIWANMKAGNSFEDIRQYIKSQGGDPSILDKFVTTLQGTAQTTSKNFQ